MLTFLPIHVYTFSRFVAEWSARCSICYDSHLNDAPKHIPQQHIHPAKTENYRMHLKTIKFAIKFNINAKTWLFIHYWLFLLKYSFPSQGMPWHHWLLRPYTSVWTIWELYLGECQILMKFNFSFNMHSIILRFCWVYALDYWGMCLAASFKWEL